MKNQNLNKGDKILCKKDYFNNLMKFTKGIEYCIILVEINTNIFDNYSDNYTYYFYDDNSRTMTSDSEYGLYSFFYKLTEVRNMKLKKLNNEKSKY